MTENIFSIHSWQMWQDCDGRAVTRAELFLGPEPRAGEALVSSFVPPVIDWTTASEHWEAWPPPERINLSFSPACVIIGHFNSALDGNRPLYCVVTCCTQWIKRGKLRLREYRVNVKTSFVGHHLRNSLNLRGH